MKRTALLLALALAAPAQAADPATLALLQAAINADGGDCPQPCLARSKRAKSPIGSWYPGNPR